MRHACTSKHSQPPTLRAADATLSYLPLAHIFDRTCEEMFLSVGGRIGYWQGKLPALVDDIRALKPTIFIGVPRVFDKIHNGIRDRVAGSGCVKKARVCVLPPRCLCGAGVFWSFLGARAGGGGTRAVMVHGR